MHKKSELSGHLALLFTALIYGGNYFIAKSVMPKPIGPNSFILLRVSGAALLFWLIAIRSPFIPKKEHWPRIFFCAIAGVATNQLLFFNGLSLTSPLHASIIMTSNPIAVLIINALIQKKATSPFQFLGAGIGAIGALMLILSNRGDQSQTASLAGDLMILINSMAWASYLVAVKPLMHHYSPIGITSWIFLIGCCLVIPFGFSGMDDIAWATLSSWQWFSLIYVVVAVTFFTYLLNMIGLHRLSPSIASVYIYFQPLFALLIGIALYFFGITQFVKDINLIFVLSASLILGGVYLVTKNEQKES